MTARFTVLASGSSGNAALLEVNGFGLLIDCGLHPRFLAARLASVGASWGTIHAAILTHTHGDHWKDLALGELRSRRIPVYAHPAHFDHLESVAASFGPLRTANLTRTYAEGQTLELASGLTCRPIRVSHDSDPTFAFRVDHHEDDGHDPSWAIGYASDLGCVSDDLVAAFAGVDVLAVEYNHDEKMERASRRPAFLVQRVLSDTGHLSNHQAADFTRAVAARSGPMFPTHLVQLHLSRDCNHPFLAESAGRNALADLNPSAAVITAAQNVPTRSIALARHAESHRRAEARSIPMPRLTVAAPKVRAQHALPGF
jgi:phosphoribosyl 1,2-cyclic phosphodiesterase